MSNPPLIFNTDFIKLSFEWALCLKQILLFAVVYSLSAYVVRLTVHDTRTTSNDDSDYPSRLNEGTMEVMREMDQRKEEREKRLAEQKEKEEHERERRANERKERISNALAARSTETKSKLCSQCGAPFGTDKVCQYCGQ